MTAEPTRAFGWFTARTGYTPSPEARGIAAVDDRYRIRGMVVFDDWTPNAVRMHVALDTPIAGRVLLAAAFEYAFNQSRRKVASAVVPEGSASHDLAKRLGFEPVGRIEAGYDDHTALVILTKRAGALVGRRAA